MRDSRRLVRILLLVMIVQISLLASHQGEFWPFSIYPMFSKAGREWTRVAVRDVSGMNSDDVWSTFKGNALPGRPVPLARYGVETIDASDFVNKTENWTESRRAAFVHLIGQSESREEDWLVFRVRGRLTEGNVDVQAEPLFLIRQGKILRAGVP